jgi:glucose-6-phosphate 1-dehydrogenase
MKTKLLIFGITGDLSTRKLLPALDRITRVDEFNDIEIIGVSRRQIDISQLLQSSLGNTDMEGHISGFSMDLAKKEDYKKLSKHLNLQDNEQLVVYLSVPPLAAAQIVDFLGDAGINTPNVKILFEKPFGVDYISATEIISRTGRFFTEDQIYRIDHYLAKEMAQNIVAFRGGNALFSNIWNAGVIEKIEVRALETLGVEGRADFYDKTGALKDVVQGHLMQLLALTLMDIPVDLNWDRLPQLRLRALESLRPADPLKMFAAQYDTYQAEVANEGSRTETFVSMELSSDAPQWQGVPITLITGKALNEKTTDVKVYFRKQYDTQSNVLTFHIQPNEGVEIELFTKKPGYDHTFETQKLAFSYPEDMMLPDAYEQVIVDAIRSRKSLFASSDEVLRSWQILQPVLDAWNMDNTPLPTYPKGSPTHNICSV